MENNIITFFQEITQMKAKVFNEEKLIREKMKKMAIAHETKLTEMSDKFRGMQNELAKLRKTENSTALSAKRKNNSANLFHDKKKKASRTASPLSRSRSRSRSRSPVAKIRSRSGSRSRSPSSVAGKQDFDIHSFKFNNTFQARLA